MNGIDYVYVFALSFGTGLGTTFGTEVAKFLINVIRENAKRRELT